MHAHSTYVFALTPTLIHGTPSRAACAHAHLPMIVFCTMGADPLLATAVTTHVVRVELTISFASQAVAIPLHVRLT